MFCAALKEGKNTGGGERGDEHKNKKKGRRKIEDQV
jgi:hypothetical protein